MKKGLRRGQSLGGSGVGAGHCPNCCPDEEGIKTACMAGLLMRWSRCPNCCPDEEGIKTYPRARCIPRPRWSPNCCPDEEGIKTSHLGIHPSSSPGMTVRIAALMKKGLRPARGPRCARAGPGSPRPNCCPDEEGIKTVATPAAKAKVTDSRSELLP